MSIDYNKNLVPNAKALRKNLTPTERKLWYEFLAKYPIRIQRQKTIGNYIVDFYCHSHKVVIEIDGGQHFDEEAILYDNKRSQFLEGNDIRVLRFTNNDVLQNFHIVCQEITNTLSPPVTP